MRVWMQIGAVDNNEPGPARQRIGDYECPRHSPSHDPKVAIAFAAEPGPARQRVGQADDYECPRHSPSHPSHDPKVVIAFHAEE